MYKVNPPNPTGLGEIYILDCEKHPHLELVVTQVDGERSYRLVAEPHKPVHAYLQEEADNAMSAEGYGRFGRCFVCDCSLSQHDCQSINGECCCNQCIVG